MNGLSFQKYRFHIISFFISLLFLALLSFGVWFFLNKIREESRLFKEFVIRQKVDEQKIAQLPDIRRQMEWVSEHEDQLNLFESEEEAVNLIKTMERVGTETGNLIQISAKSGKQKFAKEGVSDDIGKMFPKKLKNVSLFVHLEGEYGSILKFLRKVENLETFVYVSSVQIGVLEDNERAPEIFTEAAFSDGSIQEKKQEVPKKFADIAVMFFVQ